MQSARRGKNVRAAWHYCSSRLRQENRCADCAGYWQRCGEGGALLPALSLQFDDQAAGA